MMHDLRPVIYIIGQLVAVLGLVMVIPLLVDVWFANDDWPIFLMSSALTFLCGVLMALSSHERGVSALSIQQIFILTTTVWVVLPIFGALPFTLGADGVGITNAFFESMSGLTTTGATVFTGLDDLNEGVLIWRSILQWLGGIGIVIVAMLFLPTLRVGGMQIFRSEGFDTLGKVLPRATQISSQISVIYIILTLACMFGYWFVGMGWFDAIAHAMTTVSTGGFSTRDSSFLEFNPMAEYVCVAFMILGALPFVRYVQLMGGAAKPLWADSQIHVFLLTCGGFVVILAVWLQIHGAAGQGDSQDVVRKVLFNVVSIMTGTGFASENYMQWGGLAVVIIFFVGLIGGCAGSSSCSIKIFRYQLLFASIKSQVQRLRSHSGIFIPRYQGRQIADDVMGSVMSFFLLFILTLGILSILLSLTGLDFVTSVSGAVAALGNIGPGLGDQIGPDGNYAQINSVAKWLLIVAMLIGRLELMVVYVLFTRLFWRV